LHPGRDHPEVVPDAERTLLGEAGAIRLRRWSTLHYAGFPETILDVVRIDDPAYDTPLLVGTTACELTREECWVGYGHRWPVETNCFVAQDTTAMEMPRAWTATALERRISLALLTGSLLKAIAAVVVGGTAITGGRGRVVGTLIGVALLGTIGTALTFAGINAFWEKAIQGTIILVAVGADALFLGKLARFRFARRLSVPPAVAGG